jgi:hypothetical protein
MSNGYCANIKVTTAIDVDNAVAENVGLVSIGIEFIIGCKYRGAHVLLYPFSSFATIVIAVFVFRILLDQSINCHRCVESDQICLVRLVNYVWNKLSWSLRTFRDGFSYFYQHKVVLMNAHISTGALVIKGASHIVMTRIVEGADQVDHYRVKHDLSHDSHDKKSINLYIITKSKQKTFENF